jgi:hypothetical protein
MWKTIYEQLPTNQQVVYIRVLGIFGQLALATYSVARQEFTVTTTGVKIPAYNVGRWKPSI